eukprot:CAMPEP_0181098612 /NCGR_PEP_ID=MMETSP1071-20121207/12219_1 /TAXON_ID=35127 /ORGANISM="Thalassiosira sp., Strain NH16" /LENGTH=449 /DNA_ID=CAMNT_0023181219 /DNA_START=572 /DNA_END=1921 /DNA_ORIENTATION=-
MNSGYHYLRGQRGLDTPRRLQEGGGPDPDAAEEEAIIEEMVHVEEEIEEFDAKDDANAEMIKEVLKSVEEDLIEVTLPPGCDVKCFFDKHTSLANKIENTEEALLEHFQKHDTKIYNHDCGCQVGKAPDAEGGELEAEPGAVTLSVEEGAIEEIIHVEEEVEELEGQDGNSAELKEEVLEHVEVELIQAALPPGCNLDCFFENHKRLSDKIEHTEEAVLDFFKNKKKKGGIGGRACDCHGETAIIEEIVHVEDEIEELEGQDGDGAELKEEVLKSVEEELIEASLPPGCDLDCFFDKHHALAKKIENTEEALLEHFQKHSKKVYNNACGCQGGASVEGDSEPKPTNEVEEGAMEEIIHVEEEIEELEGQDGDSAELEKEVLESVEEELIEAALPPGCNLDCFFDNHKKLTDKIEHTEEAVLDFFQKQKRKIPRHACDCEETVANAGDSD